MHQDHFVCTELHTDFTKNSFPTSVIVGAESSTFSRRLTEAQKEQEEQDGDEGTIAFSKNWLNEKKPKYVLLSTTLSPFSIS